MTSSNPVTFANCSDLDKRGNITSYLEKIYQVTGFNATGLNSCKRNICNSLWGSGNPDISGIGMIFGYVFEIVLGLLFALGYTLLLFKQKQFGEEPIALPKRHEFPRKILTEGCISYFNCTIFFAASIEISCVVVLFRRDFGITALGLGGLTTQITWAVALICMLPLLWPMFILYDIDKQNRNYRLFLFCVCWLLFFYTFLSQMIGTYRRDQVGKGGTGQDEWDDEWGKLEGLCQSNVTGLSGLEKGVLNGFGAAGSIVIVTYGLLYLLWFIVERMWDERSAEVREKLSSRVSNLAWKRRMSISLSVVVVVLLVSQLWGILRLREVQAELADSVRSDYVDNQWTFGQVVAVMLFAPVVVDVGYILMKEWATRKSRSKGDIK